MSNIAADRLADRFRVQEAPVVTARTLRRSTLAFTELESNGSSPFQTGERVKEDAFVVGIQLRELPQFKFWEEGRQAPVTDLAIGDVTINDMRRDGFAIMDRPFHSLYCHIPRQAFDDVATAEGARRIETLRYDPGAGISDDTISRLMMCVRPALHGAQTVSPLFLDYVGLALVTHLTQTYGEVSSLSMVKGGLAPWQERLAKEIIDAQIKSPTGIGEIAQQCGLSVRHFTRAFQASTGQTPHEWLQNCRIARAKNLLKSTDLSLSAVSEACGFADQSHLSRVFAKVVGTPPGSWRRQSGSGPKGS